MPRNPNTIVNAWRGLESEGGDEGDEGMGSDSPCMMFILDLGTVMVRGTTVTCRLS